jgi:hypothetical protein
MPCFIGGVKIVNNAGSFIHGDTMVVSPSNSIKTYEGSGSSNVGDFAIESNILSSTATANSDLVDIGSNKVVTGI